MKINVLLFARARDLAERDRVQLELPATATVGTLREALAHEVPALEPLTSRLLVAVGTRYARDNDLLTEGDDVACFPPVSGG